MGCDIHGVVERNVNGKWIAVNILKGHHRDYTQKDEHDWSLPVALTRNYERFAALAGVRGDGPDPRGIPIDASESTAFLIAAYGADGHSHSWLPLELACRIFLDTLYYDKRPPDPEDWKQKYPASYFFEVESESVSAHRLVFWFDN